MDAQQKASYRRLVEEGRWNDAFRFKEQRRKQLRAGGFSREQANHAAWQEMAARYSPAGPVVVTAGNGDEHDPPVKQAGVPAEEDRPAELEVCDGPGLADSDGGEIMTPGKEFPYGQEAHVSGRGAIDAIGKRQAVFR